MQNNNAIGDIPVHALPPSLLKPANEVARNVKAPMAQIVSAFLGVASLTCQNSIDVQKPLGGTSSVSLALITIADSGERKTSVDKLITKAIGEFEATHFIDDEQPEIGSDATHSLIDSLLD